MVFSRVAENVILPAPADRGSAFWFERPAEMEGPMDMIGAVTVASACVLARVVGGSWG